MDIELIQNRIYQVCGTRVMLDFHLSELYNVPTKVLKQAVRRNIDRFPSDFMFEINQSEYTALRSQFVTLNPEESARGKHSKYSSFAFTEQGVAMLSSVLRSNIAIQVNILIIRAFVLLRQNLADIGELKEKIENLEDEMNLKFENIHQALNYILGPQGQRTVIKGYKK